MRILAPAKLTASLRVVGTRPDGYHLIEAEMVSLDLADELEITPAAESTLSVDGDAPAAGDNLVLRALAAAGRTASVRLTKRIPMGAGLGGGSSDAGAVLWWAGVADPAVAARLGADVPFCVHGGRATVGGVGESVEPLPFEARTYTLVLLPFGCETGAVYRAWDALGGPVGEAGNDLEPAAVAVEPRMGDWRDRIQAAAGGVRPRLAGSGSTWFLEGAFPELALDGATVVVARTVPGRDSAAPEGGR